MIWTYPCTLNNECLYQGIIRCPAIFNESNLLTVQRGLADYRKHRSAVLDGTSDGKPDWYLIAENENKFYVRLFHWRTGQELARHYREEGLMLELDVGEVTYPLMQELCRKQPGFDQRKEENVALVPASLSLFSTLKAIYHVADEAPERIQNMSHRYRNVQVFPLAMYEKSNADSLSGSSKPSAKQSRGPRGA